MKNLADEILKFAEHAAKKAACANSPWLYYQPKEPKQMVNYDQNKENQTFTIWKNDCQNVDFGRNEDDDETSLWGMLYKCIAGVVTQDSVQAVSNGEWQ